MTRMIALAAALALSCAATEPAPHAAGERVDARSSLSPTATHPPSAGENPVLAPPSSEEPALPSTDRYVVERLLEANVLFLITGEQGRIAILADEGGDVVPHRFERGAWQSIPLPSTQRAAAGASALGIYFGRDNRPRVMGHREDGAARRMVYLRHRDGVWQDQRSEIGALASDSSQLFGVLGEADPEVVCKVAGICLLKSRKGWKEVPNTIPPTSVVRVFGGKGYALTPEGIFRADEGAFVRVGPPAAWKSEATGFWVGEDGAMAVAEPATDAIYRLSPEANEWQKDVSPVVGPRDVAGPREDRWVAGDGGLAHVEGGTQVRVGDAALRLRRWIRTPTGGLAGGPSGVFAVRGRLP